MPVPTLPPREEIPVWPAGARLVVLENGLTVITLEDHSAPVVSAQAWCKAGSIDEGAWLGAGLSHILEHMLFKGTTTRGAGRIDQEVQDAGGAMNAYTSFDRTVYWINVPNTGASVAVDILCDIMQRATLPEEELEKEKQVILREMDMNHDDPSRRSSRRLFETAYTRSPYRCTVIGYPDVFNQVKREDLLEYYRAKYSPSNLFFVVAGDLSSAEIEDQIRRAFSDSKNRPQPPVVLPREPKQVAQREVVEEAPIELAHFHMAWHIPDVRDPDIPALDVLATLLGTGHSSRLYQEVRERKGLVHSADAWTYSPGNPGLFGVSAVCEREHFTAARDALLDEVDRMKGTPVSEAELAKAVKQFVAGTLSIRKTMQGQAQDLGANWMAAEDLNFSERFLAAVRRVSPEDLRRVAQTYLTVENRTLFALVPEGSIEAPRSSTARAEECPVQKLELSNGLRVLLKEDRRLPFVQFRMAWRGGVLAETESNNGMTSLVSRMLLKGAGDRTAEQIATEIESLGGSIDSYGGNNSFGLSAEVLSDDFQAGLDLLAEVALSPTFPEASFERERSTQLASIRAQRDHMLHSASRAMRRALFGPQGYGLDHSGNESSVMSANVEALRGFYERLARPQNAVLAVYGAVNPNEARAAVERAFGGWAASEFELPDVGSEFPSQTRRVIEARPKKQAVLVIGFPGVDLHSPDRHALDLIQEALSDMGSRLFLRIREKLGLAYYVGAQNFPGLRPGYFAFYAGTEPEKADQVESELLEEVATLRKEGLTEVELRRAKAKIIGQKKIARQDLGSYAMATVLDELYGLGYGHLDTEDAAFEAVTADQIRDVCARRLNPDACVVAIARPEENSD